MVNHELRTDIRTIAGGDFGTGITRPEPGKKPGGINPERKIRKAETQEKAGKNNGLMERVLVTLWVSACLAAGC